MGKLLTILGISDEVQDKLPNDVLEGEQFLNVLQTVYEQSPESAKKEALANAIAENVRLLLAEVAKVKIEVQQQPTAPQPPVQQPPAPQPPAPQPTPTQPTPPQPTPPSTPSPKKPKAPKKPKVDKEKERIKKDLQEQIDEIRQTLVLFKEEEDEYQELQNELDKISQQINQLNN
jgi:hypothetical protein